MPIGTQRSPSPFMASRRVKVHKLAQGAKSTLPMQATMTRSDE